MLARDVTRDAEESEADARVTELQDPSLSPPIAVMAAHIVEVE